MKKFKIVICVMLICGFAHSQVKDTASAVKPVSSPSNTVSSSTAAKAPAEKRTFKEKFGFGFGAAFWITPKQTYYELAPSLAYRFPKVLVTGVGYRYILRHDRILKNDLNSYGPNVFARVGLTKRIYLWTEYEILTSQYFNNNYSGDQSKSEYTSSAWFAGFGYVKSLGKKGKGGISFQVLYNIMYNNDLQSPYYSPVVYRIGYFF